MNRATRHLLAVLGILAGSSVLFPSHALAKDAVVSPLVSKGVDPLVVLNLTSLISSELDFMGAYENVDQLDDMPSGMNGACLASPSCLGNVAKGSGSPVVVAGAVAEVGKKLDLYLVLYDSGHIVRSKDFTLPNIPSVIADSMGAYVKELVTGKSATKVAADAELDDFDGVATADLFDDEEDDTIDLGGNSRRIPVPGASDDTELDDFDMFEDDQATQQKAEEEARRQREAEARRQAEEDARRQREAEARRQAEEDARRQREAEARRQAEEDARRQREAEARRQAEEDARRQREAEARRQAEEDARAAAADEEDDDFEDIQFGSAADDIEVEEVSFASAAGAIVVDDSDEEDDDFSFGLDDTADTTPAPRASRYDSLDDDTSSSRRSSRDDDRSSRYDSLDDDTSSSRRSSRDDDRGSRSSRDDDRSRRSSLDDERSSRSSRDSEARVHNTSASDSSASVVGRVGYSKFQDLAFVTYGAEATFMAMENLGIVAGVEAYSTRRAVPEALRPDETAPTTVWNTILPFNVGLQYKMSGDTVRPYLGADLQFIPGYVKDQGGLATGLRVRGGSDFMVADNFGFNLNVSAGYWSGANFDSVQRDFGTSALVPQISGGTVVAF